MAQEPTYNRPRATDRDINRIGKKTGIGSVIIVAMIELSQAQRTAIKLTLIQLRTQFLGSLITMGYQASINYRRQVELLKEHDKVANKLAALSNVFNKMDQMRPLVSLLIAASGDQGASDTYRDIEKARYKALYRARQAERAGNITSVGSRKLQSKIAEVDQYIALIDEIENL